MTVHEWLTPPTVAVTAHTELRSAVVAEFEKVMLVPEEPEDSDTLPATPDVNVQVHTAETEQDSVQLACWYPDPEATLLFGVNDAFERPRMSPREIAPDPCAPPRP